jgi:hypothetical protein
MNVEAREEASARLRQNKTPEHRRRNLVQSGFADRQLRLIALVIGKCHADMQCTNTEQETFFIALDLFFEQRNEMLGARRFLQHAVDEHFGERT